MPGSPSAMTHDGAHTIGDWWALHWERVGQHAVNLYKPFIKPWELAFDVGSHRGERLRTMRALGAIVVAIEPLLRHPEYIPEFDWLFGDDQYVKRAPVAISDHEGELTFNIHKFQPFFSTVSDFWRLQSKHAVFYSPEATVTVRVPCTTLDALIEQWGVPRFIKVDVEGYEATAIKGLTCPVNALSVEFHEEALDDLLAIVRHLGRNADYEYNYALDLRSQFILSEWVSGAELLETLRGSLTKEGQGSWGDVYARRMDIEWTS